MYVQHNIIEVIEVFFGYISSSMSMLHCYSTGLAKVTNRRILVSLCIREVFVTLLTTPNALVYFRILPGKQIIAK